MAKQDGREARGIARQLLAEGQLDVPGLFQFTLERRHFDNFRIEKAPIPGDERRARWFEAVSFMEAEPERIREMVVTFLGAAHDHGLEVVLWIQGKPQGIAFRYGVLLPANRGGELGADFERMLEGTFPGIKLLSIHETEIRGDLADLEDRSHAGLLVGIPSERRETAVETRLDDVLNGLAGRCFDVLVQAAPAPRTDVDVAVANMSFVVDLAHRLARQQISVSDSQSISISLTEGSSHSRSTSETQNWSTTLNQSVSRPGKGATASGVMAVAGTLVGAVAGSVLGGPGGAVLGAQLGGVAGGAVGKTVYPPEQESKGRSDTEGFSSSVQEGFGVNQATTAGESLQKGFSLSWEQLNRQAGLLGEVAEEHLQRVRQMKRFGGWHVSVCLAARQDSDLRLTGSLLSGALRGDHSDLESLRLLVAEEKTVGPLLKGVSNLSIGWSKTPAHPLIPGGEQPKTFLSSEELSHWFRPPSSPVVGVDVRPAVRFSAAAARVREQARGPKGLRLGHLIASGRHLRKSPVGFPLEEVARHCFVAGTTGSGKTTTVTQILSQVAEKGIPFLVLEPAKTEYRSFFKHLQGKGMNPLRLTLRNGTEPWERRLQFNPWKVPHGIPLGRYIEGIKILVRSCFAMQESLPQILERAIFEVYAEQGWSDLSEIVSPTDTRRFPTFSDFLAKKPGGTKSLIGTVVEKLGYGADPQKNLTAALTVRLESFTRGLKQSLFCGGEDAFGEMFTRAIFVELTDLNEPDIKRFVLGALVMRLASELQVRAQGDASGGLRHVTVLEEAHHFLREAVGHGPGAELARESNLLLADALAEMRGYGEGIVVADQAPAELSPAVLRNTNIKIAHRLLYRQDCDAMGDAMGLDEAQKKQLRSLDSGECLVQSASIPRPVQCQIHTLDER